MVTRMTKKGGFIALKLAPAGGGGPGGEGAGPAAGAVFFPPRAGGLPRRVERGPACRLPDFSRRSGCVPAEPYPPLKQPVRLYPFAPMTRGSKHYSTFVRTDLSTFVRTTT